MKRKRFLKKILRANVQALKVDPWGMLHERGGREDEKSPRKHRMEQNYYRNAWEPREMKTDLLHSTGQVPRK